MASEAVENEIMAFWQLMADSDVGDYKKLWLDNAMHAENAGKFVNEDERYRYQGGFNQFLIAYYTVDKDTHLGPLVFNRTSLNEIFEVDDFKKTPIVENHIKSAGSIFGPPQYPKHWVDGDGQRWRPSGGEKKPSNTEIQSKGLQQKQSGSAFYFTFPVWSAADVYDVLPASGQAKIDNLVQERKVTGHKFDAQDDIHVYIDQRISDTINRQGLEIGEHGSKAFYSVQKDIVKLPEVEQFVNPVARYSVMMHELAHSTMHLNGRSFDGRDTKSRAVEEIIAETSAVLQVRQLERDLSDALDNRPDVQDMFKDYYDNSVQYNKAWGEPIDFSEHLSNVEEAHESSKGLIKKILVDTAKAVNTLNEGEFTPEQRLEAKEKNLGILNESPKPAVDADNTKIALG